MYQDSGGSADVNIVATFGSMEPNEIDESISYRSVTIWLSPLDEDLPLCSIPEELQRFISRLIRSDNYE